MTDLLTTEQVQRMLKVDRTTIYRMVDRGELPGVRVGKQWRFAATDIRHWLQTHTTPGGARRAAPQANPGQTELPALLPLECAQQIQDAFAEALGVMMVTTDMRGCPVTEVSNPCGFFEALIHEPAALTHCVHTWQQLAAAPAIEPRFSPSETGLLCTRGLIRVGSDLKGMVVAGGIAPETWPPDDGQLAALADTFKTGVTALRASVNRVYRLDRTDQQKVLRMVQRVADIFSHIAAARHDSMTEQ